MKFVVNRESVRDNVIKAILALDIKKSMVVEIKAKKRSLDQNALWHKWIDIMALELGYMPEEMKIVIKRATLGQREIINFITGEIDTVDYSSAALDKQQFSNLMLKTSVIAAQLNINLPMEE